MQAHMSLAAHLRNRASKGVFWFHPANGEYRGLATGAKLNQMGVKAGTPDFELLIAGRMFGLELKSSLGRLSPQQRACHAEIEAAGGFVHTAHSVDEAVAVLTAWGAIHPASAERHVERVE